MRRRSAVLAALVMVGVSCRGNNPEYGNRYQALVPGGDSRRGHDVIVNVGCGSCHTIPGVRGANGLVGPPLYWFSRRTYIAGELPNSPENLVRWVRSPKSIEAATAMPTVGLTDQQARDVAAYLYTLR